MDNTFVFELSEFPEDIKQKLIEYYKGTDHRGILNDSYSRYPYLFDWQPTVEFNEIDEWLNEKIDCMTVGYVIIHWEW